MTLQPFRRALRLACVTLVSAAGLPLAAQAQWTQLSPANSPPPRNSHGMVWDAHRRVAIVHGGYRLTTGIYGDTWEWDGVTWTQRPVNNVFRNGHKLAYDPVRRVTVMFGGAIQIAGMADTWEYDGTAWTQRTPPSSPPARVNHEMCFDTARGRVVLFGGHSNTNANTNFGDTWEYDGTTWTQRSTTGPAPRVYHALAFDGRRNVAVLFAGRGDFNSWLNDTWEWDGTVWTQRTPPSSPSARNSHSMAFDPLRNRCVVHGGLGFSGASTLEWDGTTWTPGGAIGSSSTRHAAGSSWDGNRNRVLLFGGYMGVQVNDTWIYGAGVPATYTTAGTGCPGTAGTPAIAAAPGSLPWIGQTFTAAMTGLGSLAFGIAGLSDAQHLGQPLPFELSALGMPSCRQYVSLDLVVPFVPSGGSANWSLGLPNNASLVGARLHQQVATLAPGVNALGLVSSNYGTLTAGVP